MRALGRKQRIILTNMVIAGGRWAPHWKLHADEAKVLKSLRRRGLVTSDNRWSQLTDEGKRVASWYLRYWV